MNDKIKELAEQADCSIDGMGYGEGDIEAFAELIVRECAHIADNNYDCGKFPVGHKIKEHFGVKE